MRFARVAMAAVVALFLADVPVLANPLDGNVVSGSADIAQETQSKVGIIQHSDKTIIDWRSFSIATHEHTQFYQPGSTSLAVNRVIGNDPSQIFGLLSANGQVMLINQNGILFGVGSRVDVAGLVATTIDIPNDRILAEDFRFDIPGTADATVVNLGTITIAEGGLAALVAPGVENAGVIQARLGKVSLASGNAFTLDLYGDGLVQIAIDAPVMQSLYNSDGNPLAGLVANSGTIAADGGVVLLTAKAASDVVNNVINMDGIVQVQSVAEVNGEIILSGGDEGIVVVSGTLDASGGNANETGGTVKVLGDKVGLMAGTIVNVSGDSGGGTALVGGNFQGNGPEQNATTTYVDADVTINADALGTGDGGRAIVWADDTTRYYGTITARGGANSGDGGFAEVSGKQYLDYQGSAELTAASGATGTLLLDPNDITIQAGGSDTNITGAGTAADPFTTAVGGATLLTGTIEGNMATAGVLVTATGTGGDITVSDTITAPANSNFLWLYADNDFFLNADIDFSASSGSLELSADEDGDDAGSLFNGGSAITMGAGGSVTIWTVDAGTAADPINIIGTEDLGVYASGSAYLGLSTAPRPLVFMEIEATAGELVIGATDGVTSIDSDWTSLVAGTDLTLNVGLVVDSDLDMIAAQDIFVNADIVSGDLNNGQWLNIQADRNTELNADIDFSTNSDGATVGIYADYDGNDVGDLTTGGGIITMTANTQLTVEGYNVGTAVNPITVVGADDMTVSVEGPVYLALSALPSPMAYLDVTSNASDVVINVSGNLMAEEGYTYSGGATTITASGALDLDQSGEGGLIAESDVTLSAAGLGTVDQFLYVTCDFVCLDSTLSVTNTSTAGLGAYVDATDYPVVNFDLTMADADSDGEIYLPPDDIVITGSADTSTIEYLGPGGDSIPFSYTLSEAGAGIVISDLADEGLWIDPSLTLTTSNGPVTVDVEFADGNDLTIDAGSGDVTFSVSSGGGTPLGNVDLSGGMITGRLFMDALTISGASAVLTGEIGELTEQDAADAITFSGSPGAGPYTFNGFVFQEPAAAEAEAEAEDTDASDTTSETVITVIASILSTQAGGPTGGGAGAVGNVAPASPAAVPSTPAQGAFVADFSVQPLVPDVFQSDFSLVEIPADMGVAFGDLGSVGGGFWSNVGGAGTAPAPENGEEGTQ